MNTILIAENNRDFAYVIQWYFANKGYTVHLSATGEEVLELYSLHHPDIILLDISLDGELNGKDVARTIRNTDKGTPILFMSGENNSPADVVESFHIGGNFFLKKPVSLEELEVHIISALKSSPPQLCHNWEQVVFFPTEQLLSIKGKNESLTEKESGVLQVLAEQQSTLVEMRDILISVWGSDDKEESLRNTISSLRKKLEGSNINIETVKGKGYRIICK